jgi:Spy/CpxP family protein refolding chaperone
MMNKMKVKAIAGIIIVFLLGAVIGALGTGIFIGHKFRQFGKGEYAFGKFFMRRLNRELKLTDAQKPEVEKILGETEVEIRTLLHNSMAEFVEIMQRRNAQLKKILDPEQQEKLAEMFERMQKHWHEGSFQKEKPD